MSHALSRIPLTGQLQAQADVCSLLHLASPGLRQGFRLRNGAFQLPLGTGTLQAPRFHQRTPNSRSRASHSGSPNRSRNARPKEPKTCLEAGDGPKLRYHEELLNQHRRLQSDESHAQVEKEQNIVKQTTNMKYHGMCRRSKSSTLQEKASKAIS